MHVSDMNVQDVIFVSCFVLGGAPGLIVAVEEGKSNRGSGKRKGKWS